jgi:hypothetical protein
MVGFTLLSRSYYYMRRGSHAPPFPPDHRQAGEEGNGGLLNFSTKSPSLFKSRFFSSSDGQRWLLPMAKTSRVLAVTAVTAVTVRPLLVF